MKTTPHTFQKTDEPLSKTQRKEAMHELQDLGKELTEISKEQVSRLLAMGVIPERLGDALAEFRRIPSFGAQRRQLQFIGKLMRDIDPLPVKMALEDAKGESAAEVARMHRLEKWRDQFIEDENVLSELARKYPGADTQRLRQLRKNAIKEKQENRPPKSYRQIFQELKALESGPHSDE